MKGSGAKYHTFVYGSLPQWVLDENIGEGDRIEFQQYAGMGMRGKEYRPAIGRVHLLGPSGPVVVLPGDRFGARPTVVTQETFLRVVSRRKAKGNPVSHRTALKYAKALVTHERAGVRGNPRRLKLGGKMKVVDSRDLNQRAAELRSEATAAATARGHTLVAWRGDARRQTSHCHWCGMEAHIITKPMPNEIDVSGEAVALNCTNEGGFKGMNNPEGGEFQASLRGDRTKSPRTYTFRPLRFEEAKQLNFLPLSLYYKDQTGRMANVRINGRVKLWKRDPSRIEIPVKFGMYEAFRVTDPGELYVLVSEAGNPGGRKKRSSGRASPKARRFIGGKIRKLAHEGMEAPRRIAAAYSMARRRGFKLNPMSKKDFEMMAAMIADKQLHGAAVNVVHALTEFAVDLGRWANPRFDAHRFAMRILQLVGEKAPYRYVKNKPRRNPLAIYGANPQRANTVRELGRVVEIRYKRKDDGEFYKHAFKTRPRLLALSDGTIAVRP